MKKLAAFETLYQVMRGENLPLPPTLAEIYGPLQFPLLLDRSYVIGNFVQTLDGVVAVNAPGAAGGAQISGFNAHDRMLMGLLRAAASAVVVGAGTLRSVPRHTWNAESIYTPLADEFRALRQALGLGAPLNVFVTGSGRINLDLPVFQESQVPVLIVTMTPGARQLREQTLPSSVTVTAVAGDEPIAAEAVLDAVNDLCRCSLILVEGGPHLMGDFLADHCLDELFLTLAPQVAGRDGGEERPGFVAGQIFLPGRPIWGTLISVKRAESHLFLRYAFPAGH